MRADDSLPSLCRPAVSAAWSVKLPVHPNTHASDSIPSILHRFFFSYEVPATHSLIWFIFSSHFPPAVWIVISCSSFPDEGRRWGVQGEHLFWWNCKSATLFPRGVCGREMIKFECRSLRTSLKHYTLTSLQALQHIWDTLGSWRVFRL